MRIALIVLFLNKRYFYVNHLGHSLSYVLHFSFPHHYEIFEDGKEIIKGKSGGVLLGGLLFGVPGMLVAQNSRREIEKPVTSLKLVIRLNNFSKPHIEITFIDNNVNYQSTINDIYENLKLIYSTLEIIKHNEERGSEPKEAEPQKQNDIKDELVKLKELLANDLITQDEFEAKKKQILGL